jgi:hypothetical protein
MGFDFDKALNLAEQVVGPAKNLAALAGKLLPDEKIIQRPRGYRVPHANFTDAVWIEIKPRQLISQTRGARGRLPIKTSDRYIESGFLEANDLTNSEGYFPTFKFLAPVEIQENIIHQWEAYESIATRLLQKGVDITKLIDETLAVGRPIGKEIEKWAKYLKNIFEGEQPSKSMGASLNKILTGITSSTVPRVKLDTPLVYSDSSRRMYTFAFQLIDEGNAYKDVVYPVKLLQKYAAASYKDGTQITYDPPFVFSVQTLPDNKLIKIDNAACTAIQPIYRQPYRNGHPVFCELNLTFTEIEPLYRRNYDREGGQGSVTVSITPGIRATFGERQDLSIAGISTRKYVDKFGGDGALDKAVSSLKGGS